MKPIEPVNDYRVHTPAAAVPNGNANASAPPGARPAAEGKGPAQDSAPQRPSPDDTATYASYGVDEKTGTVVVKMIDKKDGELVRQIPPEENLNLAARLRQVIEKLRGKSIR